MNPIEKLQDILKELKSNKKNYVVNPQKDFIRKRKVTRHDMVLAFHLGKLYGK